jgi:hypothetical protein
MEKYLSFFENKNVNIRIGRHFAYFSDNEVCMWYGRFKNKSDFDLKLVDTIEIDYNEYTIEIYNRERYYRRYLFLLKKLIEQSKLYAEICGRPERLRRLGFFV